MMETNRELPGSEEVWSGQKPQAYLGHKFGNSIPLLVFTWLLMLAKYLYIELQLLHSFLYFTFTAFLATWRILAIVADIYASGQPLLSKLTVWAFAVQHFVITIPRLYYTINFGVVPVLYWRDRVCEKAPELISCTPKITYWGLTLIPHTWWRFCF